MAKKSKFILTNCKKWYTIYSVSPETKRAYLGGKIMKRIVSIVLVCIMVAALLPASVFAEEATPISSAEDFANIANNLSGNYILTQNITVTTPLSFTNEQARFSGTFDGNGKTITFNFTDNTGARTGLFCTVENATFKNLVLEGNVTSNVSNSTGALIGTVVVGSEVTLENITNKANVISNTEHNSDNGQGGLIGAVEGATVKMTNCINMGKIQGPVAGGFIGNAVKHYTEVYSHIELTNCVNMGEVVGINHYADYRATGGFIGCLQGGESSLKAVNCRNEGTISAKHIAANAYVGYIGAWTKSFEGCTNTGKVISGGLEIPAENATKETLGIWSDAGFSLDLDTSTLSGKPRFHSMPNTNGAKVYICGQEISSDRYTFTPTGEDRQLTITANVKGLFDGYASITIIWSDGRYSTFGTDAPVKAQTDALDQAFVVSENYNKVNVNLDSVSSDMPLRDGNGNPHGSLKNLFDTSTNNKYEGLKFADQDVVRVKFSLEKSAVPGYYLLRTGNDDAAYSGRQPREWKLYASTDGNSYVELDYKNFDLPNFNNRDLAFELNTDTSYQHYMIEFITFEDDLRNDGNIYTQIGCLQIYEQNILDASLSGFTANLGGYIGLNFHMNVPQEVQYNADAYVVFNVNGKEIKVPVGAGLPSDKVSGNLVYTCYVVAKEMTSEITAKIVSGYARSKVYTYSVAKYASKIVDGNFTPEEKALAKAMLAYGTEAQLKFNFNTTDLPTADTAMADIADLSAYKKVVKGTLSGIESYGCSASLESATALNFYFKVTPGTDINSFTYTEDGAELTAVLTSDPMAIAEDGYTYCYVQLTGIAAKDYDRSYTLTVEDASGNKMTVSYSVYAYIAGIVASADYAETHEVAKAAYHYNKAAEAYFTAKKGA